MHRKLTGAEEPVGKNEKVPVITITYEVIKDHSCENIDTATDVKYFNNWIFKSSKTVN